MLRASWLCGSVRYEIRGSLGQAVHCHCSMCGKAHHAAFGRLYAISSAGDIALYQSSPELTRTFWLGPSSSWHKGAGSFALALGTFDDICSAMQCILWIDACRSP